MIEDKLLIWRFKHGSKNALQRIYEKYKNNLLKLAVVLTGNAATAEDAVQDVFVNFAQSAAKIRIEGNLKSFLTTCLNNRIRNQKRNQQRHLAYNIDEQDCIISDSKRPEQWAILSEELKILSKAMGQLPQDQREVIALYMQGQISFRQIAKLQNVSINTVQGRFRYGLNKLQTLLNSKVTK